MSSAGAGGVGVGRTGEGLPPRVKFWPPTRIYKVVMDCWKYCKGYKFALSVARPRAQSFQLRGGGGFAPWPLSAPGPRWGLCPQTPVIRSRYTRSPCAPPKTTHGCPSPLFQLSSTLAPALRTLVKVLLSWINKKYEANHFPRMFPDRGEVLMG